MEGERNFHCGCGKSYLSYPALYTHVKNKHNGLFPEGTVTNKRDNNSEFDQNDSENNEI